MTVTVAVHLTADNITAALLPGDVFPDDPEFGAVRSVRLTRDGQNNAMVYMNTGAKDVLGLPSTVRVTRVPVIPADPGTRCGADCGTGRPAVHVLTVDLPVGPVGTALCAFHSPYDV